MAMILCKFQKTFLLKQKKEFGVVHQSLGRLPREDLRIAKIVGSCRSWTGAPGTLLLSVIVTCALQTSKSTTRVFSSAAGLQHYLIHKFKLFAEMEY